LKERPVNRKTRVRDEEKRKKVEQRRKVKRRKLTGR